MKKLIVSAALITMISVPVTGLIGAAVPANAATAAVSLNLVQKKTATRDAKVQFCNHVDVPVDVAIGEPRHEQGQYARVFPGKCHTFTTPRTLLGFHEYTQAQGDVDKGMLNTTTGKITYRF